MTIFNIPVSSFIDGINSDAKAFSHEIGRKLKALDPTINGTDLYFAQFRDGYSLAYKPKYPEITPRDIDVYRNSDGSITVIGKARSILPGERRFESLKHFVLACKRDI